MEKKDLEKSKSQGRLDSRGSYPETGETVQDVMEKENMGKQHTDKIHKENPPPKGERERPRKSDLESLDRNER